MPEQAHLRILNPDGKRPVPSGTHRYPVYRNRSYRGPWLAIAEKAAGKSLGEIAAEMGLAKTTVARIVEETAA